MYSNQCGMPSVLLPLESAVLGAIMGLAFSVGCIRLKARVSGAGAEPERSLAT
jgi:hypothetical protein